MTTALGASRFILHADMDAFYASIEQRDHPELRGRPVIVGANSARGVVPRLRMKRAIYGVRSAMPGFRARALCPEGVFVAPNMERYADVLGASARGLRPVHARDRTARPGRSVPRHHRFGALVWGPLELATQLKQRVRERTDLTVTVAVAPNKLVAKIACTLAKPDGLRVVAAHEVRALLDPLPLRQLWGIGPVLAQKLARLG